MSQKKLNSLSIMYDNKDLLDNLSLIDVANEFVGLQPNRKNAFGSFTVKDLQLFKLVSSRTNVPFILFLSSFHLK